MKKRSKAKSKYSNAQIRSLRRQGKKLDYNRLTTSQFWYAMGLKDGLRR